MHPLYMVAYPLPKSPRGDKNTDRFSNCMANTDFSLFRLLSAILQRKDLQIQGYALEAGMEGDLENNYK